MSSSDTTAPPAEPSAAPEASPEAAPEVAPGAAPKAAAPRVRPAAPKPKHQRGPNGPVALVQLACVVIVLVLIAEFLVGTIADHFPRGLDNLGELVLKRHLIDDLEGKPLNVLFTGDSTMDAAADPAVFVATSTRFTSAFNSALLGAPFGGQATWLQSVVLPKLKPRVIIQMVSPIGVTVVGVEGAKAGLVDDNVDSEIQQSDDSVWVSLDHRAREVSYLVRYRQSLRQPQVVYDAIVASATGETPTKVNPLFMKMTEPGYWEQNLTPQGRFSGFNAGHLTKKFNPGPLTGWLDPPPDWVLFDRLLDAEVASGASVAVVFTPIAAEVWLASGIDVPRWRLLEQQMSERAKQRGVATIDLSKADFARKDFNDYLHLNETGSQKFSIQVAEHLDEMCATGELACT